MVRRCGPRSHVINALGVWHCVNFLLFQSITSIRNAWAKQHDPRCHNLKHQKKKKRNQWMSIWIWFSIVIPFSVVTINSKKISLLNQWACCAGPNTCPLVKAVWWSRMLIQFNSDTISTDRSPKCNTISYYFLEDSI
jgi:hypothetical protein